MKRTVFVVGAGASHDFGMPLGADLVRRIRGMIADEVLGNPTPLISSAMRTGEPGDYGAAARDLAGGMTSARSIDRFLYTRRDRPLVVALGKRAIARAIIEGEHNSPLGPVDFRSWETVHRAMVSSSSSWIAKLFSLLQEGVEPRRSDTIFDRVSFVTFNYDRLIEVYLRLAFQHVMDKSPDEAAALAGRVQVEHVYGSLGPLDETTSTLFGLGPAANPSTLDIISQPIRTFMEQHDEAVLSRSQRLLYHAELIVFLGFGFDSLNVHALFPARCREDQACIATALGLGPKEQADFTYGVANGMSPFVGCTAAQMMDEDRFRMLLDR